MPKPILKIKHVVIRDDGRPHRFSPGPALRKLGFRGHDLTHPDGRPFTLEDCKRFATTIDDEARQRRSHVERSEAQDLRQHQEAGRATAQTARRGIEDPDAQGTGHPPLPHGEGRRPDAQGTGHPPLPHGEGRRPDAQGTGPYSVSLAHLIAELARQPGRNGVAVTRGRRRERGLNARTVEWYRKLAALMAERHPDLWARPAASIAPEHAQGIIERLWEVNGLHQARGLRALLSKAWNVCGPRHRLYVNPWADKFTRLPMPKGRVNPVSVAAITHLVATADDMGRPDIGDVVLAGALTGLRQADRLTVARDSWQHGRLELITGKRHKGVSLLVLPRLAARLEAALARRSGGKIDWPQLMINERLGQPWHPMGEDYRKDFAKVRDKAAKSCPELKGFRDQDLRDTFAAWCEEAGATTAEIAGATTHSEAGAEQILDAHYRGPRTAAATAAVTKLGRFLEGKE